MSAVAALTAWGVCDTEIPEEKKISLDLGERWDVVTWRRTSRCASCYVDVVVAGTVVADVFHG